jgi:hypothetical protein
MMPPRRRRLGGRQGVKESHGISLDRPPRCRKRINRAATSFRFPARAPALPAHRAVPNRAEAGTCGLHSDGRPIFPDDANGHRNLTAAAGAGFCGILTTFSSFGYETIRMAEDGNRLAAVLHAAASIIIALGAAYCGMALAHAITA